MFIDILRLFTETNEWLSNVFAKSEKVMSNFSVFPCLYSRFTRKCPRTWSKRQWIQVAHTRRLSRSRNIRPLEINATAHNVRQYVLYTFSGYNFNLLRILHMREWPVPAATCIAIISILEKVFPISHRKFPGALSHTFHIKRAQILSVYYLWG